MHPMPDIQKRYIDNVDYQLFVVNTIENGLGFTCGFKKSGDLTILTCFYAQRKIVNQSE